jgi:2-polyprenyl-6-methoxyphenol hydroxylase-like FAD-dependent oxidoreductase
MKICDVAIVGGGLAGATAAATLGKAGYDVALIDPHETYPPEFRCEKLDASQVELLRKTGLAEPVLRQASLDGAVTVARYGRCVGSKQSTRYGIIYDALVNAIRGQVPASVSRIRAKVTGVANGADRQTLMLSGGGELSARLVVMANGLHPGLAQSLGIERPVVSRCHTMAIGFDMRPVGRASFGFKALTYYPEKASDDVAYMSIFPAGGTLRVNLFTYWQARDERLAGMRDKPVETLMRLWPRLERVMGNFVVENVRIRPIDLYVTEGYRQPGIVLVGDAFATACPAVGVGANKVLTDVERLCNVHIPRWLASPGMGVDKIASFYADPVKRACDENSAARSFYLRSLSTNEGMAWRARRWTRFGVQMGVYAMRRARASVALLVRDHKPRRNAATGQVSESSPMPR